MPLEQKIGKLENWFANHTGTITAFSGGIDSALVLYLSKQFLGEKGIGCISISPSLKRRDYAEAIAFCKQFEIHLEVIETQEVYDENYLANPANRCYFCKSHLYNDIHLLLDKYPGYTLLNGTNQDDLGDYRPGLQAASEHEIQSPLADCGLTKPEVRQLGLQLGLPNWNKPASPCLSSRVPYGNIITQKKLTQIELAETILNEYGFQDVRVRHYGEEARIEVPANELALLKEQLPHIQAEIVQIGFASCVIDEEGLVSGKLNRVLDRE